MSVLAPVDLRVRIRARIAGTVQGVGFRPFVYRLAQEERLAGFVFNDERGVVVEVEGPPSAVERFMARLRPEAPPLARVEHVARATAPVTGARAFEILSSSRLGNADVPVAPDSATCCECLAELLDPSDRRYRYPFINCTNCGPRFTIVRSVPYDRSRTTMAGFEMCDECRREYEDPGERRFHAQPNACPRCGPHVWLVDRSGAVLCERGPALAAAAAALRAGAILAVKGLGGFHLACLAAHDGAVAELRSRKHREDKPFAVMAPDLGAARGLVELSDREEALLVGHERPIVIARRLPGAPVAAAVAPRSPELGVMLPYSPLHHLLLGDVGEPLLMTSGNVSDEPIAYRDEDALERLSAIADTFLLHNRQIETRTDDSVLRVLAGERVMVRRSRGYVPGDLELPMATPRPVLACGAEQKNTFCIAKGSRAWVSHHIGDLEHHATLRAFGEGAQHFERLFAVTPEVIAHDLHPDYLSTAYAREREGVDHIGVQHHHAHLAATLAEYGLAGPAVGAIFDGTGYGLDGTIWGGELLVGDLLGFDRAGWLWPVRMPGATAAVRQPWRMAFSWLAAAFGEPQPLPATMAGRVSRRHWDAMTQVAGSAEFSPVTTSMGRLFDGVAALCGIGLHVSYEGQAAIELEGLAARSSERRSYEFSFDGTVLDPRPLIRAVADDLSAGIDVGAVAAGFHGAVAAASADACASVASRRGLELVALSGGVFQNRLLLEAVAERLTTAGLRVLIARALPPNDGGISFGQAAVAAARMAAVRTAAARTAAVGEGTA